MSQVLAPYSDTATGPLTPQRDSGTLWATIDVTLLFLTLMVSSDMLVHLGFGQSLVWLMCYGLALLRVMMLWPQFFALLMRNKVLLAYPAACLASILWSHARGATLSASIQLTMTFLIASYLGWRYSMRVITRAAFIVLTLAMLLSLAHWATGLFPWSVYSRAGGLIGVFSQKNMLGQRALFCIVISVAILLMYPFDARIRLKIAAALGILVTFLALFLSQSMTSVLLVPPLVGMLALICYRRIPPVMAALSAFLTLLAITLGPVLLSAAGIDPVQAVLDGVGKDATLTGRTVLWEVARHVNAEYPILGVGYQAFWSAPDFAHERLMTQHAGAVTSVSFHNFVLEILVAAGWPALLAMIALLITATRRFWRLIVEQGSVSAACALTLLAGIIITSMLGPSLYRGHEFMIVLLIMYMVSAQEDRSSVLPPDEWGGSSGQVRPHFASTRGAW